MVVDHLRFKSQFSPKRVQWSLFFFLYILSFLDLSKTFYRLRKEGLVMFGNTNLASILNIIVMILLESYGYLSVPIEDKDPQVFFQN